MELKRSWLEDAMQEIAAFANTHGGTLYIGVDKNGDAVGTDVSDQAQQMIGNKITSHLAIVPRMRVETFGGTATLAIDVRQSKSPVLLRGVHYVRSGSRSVRTYPEEWSRLVLEQMGITWDGLAAEATVDGDVDAEKVRAYVRSARGRANPRISPYASEDDPVEITLGHLGLLSGGRPTNAALLLFGRDPQRLCRGAQISIAYFRSTNDFTPYPDAKGTVFEQIDAALRAIEAANPPRVTFQSASAAGDGVERTQRVETPVYPPLALKEALTNAVVHRDYTRVGAEVGVRMYLDRIVIMSPGGLLPGVTPERLREVPHPSERRNPLIAEACFIDYWVERFGTGTTRMIELCRQAGMPDPEFEADRNNVIVTFHRDLVSDVLLSKGFHERHLEAVHHAQRHGSLTNRLYREITGVSARQAVTDLRALEKVGVLQREGQGRSARYVFVSIAQ